MKKTVIIIILLICVITPKVVTAQETDSYVPPDLIEPYTYISSITCSISSADGNIYPFVLVRGKNSYDIYVTLTLQVRSGDSWVNVTKWTESKHGISLSMSKSASCIKGKTYRAVCKAIVNNESVQNISGTTKTGKAWWLTAFQPHIYMPGKKAVDAKKLKMTGAIFFDHRIKNIDELNNAFTSKNGMYVTKNNKGIKEFRWEGN